MPIPATVQCHLSTLAVSLTVAFGITAAHAGQPPITCAATTVLHVTPDNEIPTGDGTSWDAPIALQQALAQANANTEATQCFELQLKQGVYKPHASDINASFNVTRPMQIKGGYLGISGTSTERELNARNTVLTGDLAGDDNGASANNGITADADDIIGANSARIMIMLPGVLGVFSNEPTLASFTLLEGVTISGGHNVSNNTALAAGLGCSAYGTNQSCSPLISHAAFIGNLAHSDITAVGAAAVFSASKSNTIDPHIRYTTFNGNHARGGTGTTYGGALMIEAVEPATSQPIISHSVFHHNRATGQSRAYGGALFAMADGPTLVTPHISHTTFHATL